METSSPTNMAPLLLRNLLTTLFIYADKSVINLAEKYKLLELIRYTLYASFLFLLRILPSFFPSLLNPIPQNPTTKKADNNYVPAGDSEKLIDENNREGSQALREVNRTVLSLAFDRTLTQLEAAVVEQGGQEDRAGDGGSGSGPVEYKLSQVLKAVRRFGTGKKSPAGMNRLEACSAEKLAAELLWLAQKLVSCGCVEEAVSKWAVASNLAWLGLWAEPRLQGSLVKISAFLFKQSKDLGLYEIEESKKEQQRQTKKKMLLSWLPLLCRASNGTDVPILSLSERVELERVLEESIEMLEQEEEQEQVLSLWLDHFTHCPSSDWPNLHASYTRWCNASRKLLVLQ
ncbi:hypothetical protein CMV_014415 [Castanea mollissima]|uniref:1,8-cineole synthase n=1 Tax=Castanea mollissima TaxID=60419 RepID=A0A8J4VUG5_9ROSI|nr:hypothetical protein CMV_014415 [Castanea mollissima]